MGRAAAGLLALVVLTGCVPIAEPPEGGFTHEQSLARATETADLMWSLSPYTEQRPSDFTVSVVSAGEWPYAVVSCMSDAGYYGYTAFGDGGLSYEGASMTDDEQLTQLICFAGIQTDPDDTGALNPAELGYLYDYYREVAVPCLELAGVEVSTPPTRAVFIEEGGGWSPDTVVFQTGTGSFEMGASAWNHSTPGGDPSARCVVWPPEWQQETGE